MNNSLSNRVSALADYGATSRANHSCPKSKAREEAWRMTIMKLIITRLERFDFHQLDSFAESGTVPELAYFEPGCPRPLFSALGFWRLEPRKPAPWVRGLARMDIRNLVICSGAGSSPLRLPSL